jgi:hypothetical protein
MEHTWGTPAMNRFYQHTQVCAPLTPWGRVLLEKLTVCQLVKKFLTFSGSRRFISTFTRACHLPICGGAHYYSLYLSQQKNSVSGLSKEVCIKCTEPLLLQTTFWGAQGAGWTERSHSKKEAGMAEPCCLHPPWKCDAPIQPRRPNSIWTGMGGKFCNICHTVPTWYILIQCFGLFKKFLVWKWLIGSVHLVKISLPRSVVLCWDEDLNRGSAYHQKLSACLCMCVF